MTDTYRGGYKKALLDVKNLLESTAFACNAKSKKQFQTLTISMLKLLLTDPATLDHMMDYGSPECRITPDCKCVPI